MTAEVLAWLRDVHERAATSNTLRSVDSPIDPDCYRLTSQHRMTCGFDQIARGSSCRCDGPASVLARVEAERAILAEHEQVPGEHRFRGRSAADVTDPRGCAVCHENDGIVVAAGPCRTVLLLAAGWRHRPGYQASWSV